MLKESPVHTFRFTHQQGKLKRLSWAMEPEATKHDFLGCQTPITINIKQIEYRFRFTWVDIDSFEILLHLLRRHALLKVFPSDVYLLALFGMKKESIRDMICEKSLILLLCSTGSLFDKDASYNVQ